MAILPTKLVIEMLLSSPTPIISVETVDTDAVMRLIQSNSRRYAKRQITFIKAMKDVEWICADDTDVIEKKLSDFLRRQNF